VRFLAGLVAAMVRVARFGKVASAAETPAAACQRRAAAA